MMEDMTGRWAWRGNKGSQADDAAPGNRAGTVPADRAEAVAGDDRHGGAGELERDGEERHGGASNGTAGGMRAPADPRLPRELPVPAFLQRAAAWSWRLLLVGLLVYVAFRVASALRLVVLPCIAALLLTALLQPLTARLRRAGMPSLAATWCTVLAAVVVLASALR